MEKRYSLIYDKVIIKQLKKAAKNQQIKNILTKIQNKIEVLSPLAGILLDSKLFIYEVKNKHPPIRVYFKHNIKTALAGLRKLCLHNLHMKQVYHLQGIYLFFQRSNLILRLIIRLEIASSPARSAAKA